MNASWITSSRFFGVYFVWYGVALNDRVRFWEREGEAPAEPLAQRELRPPVRELRPPLIVLGHLGIRVAA